MKKIIQIPVVLCFLAFVMSMSFIFVTPIELRAADEPTEKIFWYIKASKDAEGNEIVNDKNYKICTLIISSKEIGIEERKNGGLELPSEFIIVI